ncbi:hypothetical protein BH11MYX3_BH11MYX3_44020 [soil metagenome]
MTDAKPRSLSELVLIAHIIVFAAAITIAVQVFS